MIRIMLKKKFSFLTLFGILPLFLFSCSQVQKAFDSERKNSNQEFLVEKKMPLSMPPDFNKLPTPKNIVEENQSENADVKILILENDKDMKVEGTSENLNKDFKKFILDKIKNN